jgi:Ran GTPase-activating protein (RanGAP) involved in mRNA processing and transport
VIADSLKENKTLTYLNLCSNDIGPKGAKVIADSLKENKTLNSLCLEFNKIGSNGAKAISDSLKENTTLTSLDLGCNDIGPEGAKAITESLRENKALTSLELRNNNIGPKGAMAIADSLKENKTHLEKVIVNSVLMASLRANKNTILNPSIYHVLPIICGFLGFIPQVNQNIEKTSFCQHVTGSIPPKPKRPRETDFPKPIKKKQKV